MHRDIRCIAIYDASRYTMHRVYTYDILIILRISYAGALLDAACWLVLTIDIWINIVLLLDLRGIPDQRSLHA